MNVEVTEVKLSLSADEFSVMLTHFADKEKFKKRFKIRDKLRRERPNFKSVNRVLTLDDLEALLADISKVGNEGNASEQDQYRVDSLFGKLAHTYNTDAHQ